jgi:dGTP triphosphohydrolase
VGYRRVVKELFDFFREVADGPKSGRNVLPVRYREMLGILDDQYGYVVTSDARTRVAADMVAGMTDVEALSYYQRLTGHRPGSVFLPPIN